MRKVCQRFCKCGSSKSGYTRDPDTGLWVHAECGFPTEAVYIESLKRGETPVVPRSRWGKPSPAIDIEKYKKMLSKRTKQVRAKYDAQLIASRQRQSTERGVRRAR